MAESFMMKYSPVTAIKAVPDSGLTT